MPLCLPQRSGQKCHHPSSGTSNIGLCTWSDLLDAETAAEIEELQPTPNADPFEISSVILIPPHLVSTVLENPSISAANLAFKLKEIVRRECLFEMSDTAEFGDDRSVDSADIPAAVFLKWGGNILIWLQLFHQNVLNTTNLKIPLSGTILQRLL